MAHTQGTWEVRDTVSGLCILAENGGAIATMNRIASDDVVAGNARLMAAAPLLLAALRGLMSHFDKASFDDAFANANAAIVKATGSPA